MFFNPALFHAAGTNPTTDVRRMANLLQVSSPFGRAMETVDRRRVVEAVYPALLSRKASGMCRRASATSSPPPRRATPSDEPRPRPAGERHVAPTQADLVRRALGEAIVAEELADRLAAQERRTRSH